MNCCKFILFLVGCSLNEASIKSDVRNYLGSRTPYRFRYNRNDTRIKYPKKPGQEYPNQTSIDEEAKVHQYHSKCKEVVSAYLPIKDCKDTQIWMLVRHGTRLPSDTDIMGINTTLRDLRLDILLQHQSGQGKLSRKQLSRFKEWSPDVDMDQNKFLTAEGEEEMFLLAKRMQKRFPGAIKHKYNNDSFLFKYTATQRAQESARHFANGLFSKKDAQDVIFAPAAKIEPVIRFYKHCDKWQKQVKKNPMTYKEQNLFAVSMDMNKTLESISKRLGYNSVLGLDKVNLMYKVCGFETSWYKYIDSPWCYAFEREDAEVMEYYNDLKLYWLDGYGFELTYRQACLAIKNMFQTFKNKDGPNATFMFAHSGTIVKILTHLGLYKPESPLRGDALVINRAWKSSIIDCFAANLAFVLFKCKDGDHVLTLHQERIIKLPMCDKELCPLSHLLEYFHDSVYDCDYNDMCSLESNTKDEL